MGKKEDNSVYIELVGGQSTQVTGSSTVVSYNTKEGRKHLLIELGMKQGGSIWDEYIENKEMLDDIPIKYAEYCFVMHDHCDHIGMLPALNNRGFEGRVIITEKNKKICKKMLPDSTKIHMGNCKYLRQTGKKAKDLYTMQDMWAVMDIMDTYSVGEIHQLDEYVSFRFTDNSHIISATQLELFIKKPNGHVVKIGVTSDLGNTDNYEYTYFTKPTIPISNCDTLLIESTYGKGDRNFNKKDCIRERKELKKDILDFIGSGNSVLVPVFSLSRLQNIMGWIFDNLKDNWDISVPIIVDTKLGNQVNELIYDILEGEDLDYWKKVMNWKGFKFLKDFDSSLAFLSSKQHALILSSSGMLSGGRSSLHAKQVLSNSDGAILFCGYCSPNTLGGQILDDSIDRVEIEGGTYLKRCTIKKFSSFSSHASQRDLVNYVKQCNCNTVVLMHGDEEAKRELKLKMEEELSKMNRTTKVAISYKDYTLKL